MPGLFRVYTVDDKGRTDGEAVVLNVDSVDAAIRKARKLAKEHAVELWHGERRVARIPKDD